MRGTLNVGGTKYYLRITSQVPGLADGRLAGVGMYHRSVLSSANFPGAVSLNNFPNLNTWLRRQLSAAVLLYGGLGIVTYISVLT